MPDLRELLVVFFAAMLGGSAGYLLEQNNKRKAGEIPKFNWWHLSTYLVLGLLAAVACFFLLTEGRAARPTDFVIASIAAMKGADWLQSIGDSVINKTKIK